DEGAPPQISEREFADDERVRQRHRGIEQCRKPPALPNADIGPSSDAGVSLALLVAMSTTNFASWAGSRGRFALREDSSLASQPWESALNQERASASDSKLTTNSGAYPFGVARMCQPDPTLSGSISDSV
ncbi:MAG: hypothetical protein WBD43_05125, partial [Methylovirgula sp.]